MKEEKSTARAVRGVCEDAKGLQEAAYLATASSQVDVSEGSGELMFCQAGDVLVAMIGEVTNGSSDVNFGLQPPVQCLEGQSLYFGNGGRLACGPSSQPHFAGMSARGGARFAEVYLVRKISGHSTETTASYGATTFNGGVGY